MICPLMLLSSDQDLIIERKEAKERQIHETMLASFPLFVANINCFRDLPSGPKGLLLSFMSSYNNLVIHSLRVVY